MRNFTQSMVVPERRLTVRECARLQTADIFKMELSIALIVDIAEFCMALNQEVIAFDKEVHFEFSDRGVFHCSFIYVYFDACKCFRRQYAAHVS